jgi:hypothetical protein
MITPLHKKGDKNLHNRLSQYVQDNNTIPKEQIGYKAKTRTSDHIYTLKTIIDKYINKLPRKYLFCCFVDFKSAFDTVWRNGLLFKLLKAGVGSNFFPILSNLYSSTTYAIKMNDGLSEEFDSNVGIKQGCVLSPILFNIFWSDLPNIFDRSCDPVKLFDENITCLMFADDLVLMSDTATGLQSCLSKLESYCAKWKLTVNTTKTKVMIFNKGGHIIRRFRFTLNQSDIDIVTNYCYLGINFSASGNFNLAIESLHDKATKALFKLKQHNLRDNVVTAFKLFNALILPILRYGCEVWAAFQIKGLNDKNFLNLCDKVSIEKINGSFCKYLLGVNKYTSNHAVKGELGSWGLILDFIRHAVKYWFRVCDSNKLHSETGRYTKPKTPLNLRTCPKCPNEIEDETHFILNCKF